jgi:hypothetical protein
MEDRGVWRSDRVGAVDDDTVDDDGDTDGSDDTIGSGPVDIACALRCGNANTLTPVAAISAIVSGLAVAELSPVLVLTLARLIVGAGPFTLLLVQSRSTKNAAGEEPTDDDDAGDAEEEVADPAAEVVELEAAGDGAELDDC